MEFRKLNEKKKMKFWSLSTYTNNILSSLKQ